MAATWPHRTANAMVTPSDALAKGRELFAEVKYLPDGCSRRFRFDHIRKVEGIRRDAERLAHQLELGRCLVAAVLVVDDGLFEENDDPTDWPPGVRRLVSPGELRHRGLA